MTPLNPDDFISNTTSFTHSEKQIHKITSKTSNFRKICTKLSESLESIKNKINGLGFISNKQVKKKLDDLKNKFTEESSRIKAIQTIKVNLRVVNYKAKKNIEAQKDKVLSELDFGSLIKKSKDIEQRINKSNLEDAETSLGLIKALDNLNMEIESIVRKAYQADEGRVVTNTDEGRVVTNTLNMEVKSRVTKPHKVYETREKSKTRSEYVKRKNVEKDFQVEQMSGGLSEIDLAETPRVRDLNEIMKKQKKEITKHFNSLRIRVFEESGWATKRTIYSLEPGDLKVVQKRASKFEGLPFESMQFNEIRNACNGLFEFIDSTYQRYFYGEKLSTGEELFIESSKHTLIKDLKALQNIEKQLVRAKLLT